MQDDLKAIAIGAMGGALATAPMSLVMGGARRTGLMGRYPPHLIAEAALDAGDLLAHKTGSRRALAMALHGGFGIGAGALFAVFYRRLRAYRWLPAPWGPIPQGVIFGSLVWTLSYLGWVPALGIMPSAERDGLGRPFTMVLAHWVYGATLGLIVGRATAER